MILSAGAGRLLGLTDFLQAVLGFGDGTGLFGIVSEELSIQAQGALGSVELL